MAGTQHLFYISLHVINNIFIFSLHRDALYIRNTHHAVLRRCQRNINHVILIHTHAALTLAFQNTDNLKRCLVDTHDLAHRVALWEQAVSNGLTDNCHPAAAYKVTIVQNTSVINLKAGNGKVAWRCTFNTAGPVLIACNHLIASVDTSRNVGNAVNLLSDSLHIIIRQLNAFTGRQTCTGRSTAAGGNNQQITAQLGDIILDILLQAKAKTDHRNNSANTDNNTKKCQEGAQLIGNHALQSHFNAFIQHKYLPSFISSASRRASAAAL